ncbi:MAG: hypothetical protein JSR61_02685 [Proteobacteria bacterium]|nr:hypothetical protein [Pseudomonadota bacterium]
MNAARSRMIDDTELDEIERDLDELEALLAQPKRRRHGALPAVGGGTITTKPKRGECLVPRQAAFARAIADGLKPIAAAFQAGYRSPNRMTIWRLMRDKRVVTEIERLQQATREAPLS